MKKRIVKLVTAVIIFVVIFQIIIYSLPLTSKPKKSDAILILGCRLRGEKPSVFLTERTKQGANLFKKGYGEYIIVSGGKGINEEISEAEGMRRILINEGVDEHKIILEDNSKNTAENLQFSSKIIREKGFKDVIIVSNDFHLKRVSILAYKNKIKATYSGIMIWDYWHMEIYGGLREMPAIIKDLIFN